MTATCTLFGTRGSAIAEAALALLDADFRSVDALWDVFADTFPAQPLLGGSALGALHLMAALVSKWSGARKHLAASRPVLGALLAKIDNDPRAAPVFARHWPPAA